MKFHEFNNKLRKDLFGIGKPLNQSKHILYVLEIKKELDRISNLYLQEVEKTSSSELRDFSISDKLLAELKAFEQDARNYLQHYEDTVENTGLVKLYEMSFNELTSYYWELNPRY